MIREERNSTANQGSGKNTRGSLCLPPLPSQLYLLLVPESLYHLSFLHLCCHVAIPGGKICSLLSLRGQADLAGKFYDQIAVNLPLTAEEKKNLIA